MPDYHTRAAPVPVCPDRVVAPVLVPVLHRHRVSLSLSAAFVTISEWDPGLTAQTHCGAREPLVAGTDVAVCQTFLSLLPPVSQKSILEQEKPPPAASLAHCTLLSAGGLGAGRVGGHLDTAHR